MLIQNINNSKKAQLVLNKTKNNNVLVYYYASWCGYCQQFKDEWDKIKKDITKNNTCDIVEVESEELKYVPKLKTHFKGFPTLILYTKKEFTNSKKNNKGLINLFMNNNDESVLPSNAKKYENERTLEEVMKFLNLHLNSKTSSSKLNNIHTILPKLPKKKNSKVTKSKLNNKGAKKSYKTKTKKNNKKGSKNKPSHLKSPKYKTVNHDSSYYTKKEILKMKKDRQKNSKLASRLKKELSESFKI